MQEVLKDGNTIINIYTFLKNKKDTVSSFLSLASAFSVTSTFSSSTLATLAALSSSSAALVDFFAGVFLVDV
jgi:hypothetical protein